MKGLSYVMVAAVTSGLFGMCAPEASADGYYKILSRESMSRGTTAVINTVQSYPVVIQSAASPCLQSNTMSYPVAVQTTAAPCLQSNTISYPVAVEGTSMTTIALPGSPLLERTTTVRPKRFLQLDLQFGGF